jgi:hypothetical protein
VEANCNQNKRERDILRDWVKRMQPGGSEFEGANPMWQLSNYGGFNNQKMKNEK